MYPLKVLKYDIGIDNGSQLMELWDSINDTL